jgi:hypothetical protein
MPGKLPIDRVRAAEHTPRIYERTKRRFAEKQAKLNRQLAPDQDPPGPPPASAPDGRDDAHEHGGVDQNA